MQITDLKEEHILGESIKDHWYYISKGKAVRALLGRASAKTILDVGAGSGVFPKQFIAAGLTSRAVCVDPEYATERTENVGAATIEFVRRVVTVDQDLVLMMDVLEHVDDDYQLVMDYVSKMKSGSRLVITVPAFEFLWSGHDVFLEHRRRYTASQVETLVRRAGLDEIKVRYFFGALFPVIAILRLLKRARASEPKSDLKKFPHWLNTLLIYIHNIEYKLILPFNKLAGLSVVCVCKKP